MKILLAEPRGFCAGVAMAVESLERAIELFGVPLYVYHEIIHNRTVVDRFRDKGVKFVDDVLEVPHGATVLYSAHGVSPAVRRQAEARGLITVDCTCPLVNKVHSEVSRFVREGRLILLIGHAGHDETVGTLGIAPSSVRLIETLDDVRQLDIPPAQPLAFLTQTTLSVDETKQVIAALREKYPDIVGPSRDDICYATQNRQDAVRKLAPEADIVLVFGSQNSSNSRRLAELASQIGKPAFLIDSYCELEDGLLDGIRTVLITSGASAPDDVVADCVAWLQRQYGADVETRQVGQEHVHFPLPLELTNAEQA